jgi:hypothetical protein
MVKKDYKLPPEWRKHQSEGRIRRYQTQPHPFKGQALSEEWRKAISISLLQYYSEHEVWNKGLHIHSEETRHSLVNHVYVAV